MSWQNARSQMLVPQYWLPHCLQSATCPSWLTFVLMADSPRNEIGIAPDTLEGFPAAL